MLVRVCCRFRKKDFGSNDARRANQTRSAEGSGRQSTTETHNYLPYQVSVSLSHTQLPPLSGQCFTPTHNYLPYKISASFQHTTTSLIRSVFHSNTCTQNYLPHQASASLQHTTTSLIRSVFHSNKKLPHLEGHHQYGSFFFLKSTLTVTTRLL